MSPTIAIRDETVTEIATCKNCDWGQEGPDAHSLALAHTKKNGHHVVYERSLKFTFIRAARKKNAPK